ncbi:MAG: energy-coupling factor ABC transporter ATP-binding protein [bacterium]
MEKKKVINISNLYYKYPDGTAALNGVNLTVRQGESVAVVGHNGAGKSTLLKQLNGVFTGKGKVEIAGLPMCRENLDKIRSRVGIVFQDPDDQLFCPSVYDDVAFGPVNMGLDKAEVEERVNRTLAGLGVAEFSGRPAHHLSFGQKKRVAIATILSMDPEIIVFDEPSSNLDPKNEQALLNIIKKLSSTKIIVSHDLPMLFQLCNRVVVMEKGKINHDLSMREFVQDKELIKEHGLDFSFKCRLCAKYEESGFVPTSNFSA